jgi:3-keto-disaccharide hydrolase
VVSAKQELIAGINVPVAPNEWHTLRVRAQGGRLAVWFDGAQSFVANDTTFRNAGKIALWTQADSVTRFADIAITALPKLE